MFFETQFWSPNPLNLVLEWPQNGPIGSKHGTVWRAHWSRLGPCLGSFFEVFCIKVSEVQPFGFSEALWLSEVGDGKGNREAFWAKPVLRRFSRL